MEELQEIRRIWVVDKHELEDSLPRIYREITGEDYPGAALDDDLVLGASEMALLAEACGEDRLHYELSRELLSITRQQRNAARRAGLFENIQSTFKKHFYDDEADALSRARAIAEERNRRKQRDYTDLTFASESTQRESHPETL
jgi:DNA sulfur modification protein DndC